ncbi:MAG: hypothetical protein MUE71_05585, partial [Chitinophagaceae bacterium]|nr:hypothetical protein [Chitinophagaceae bacterium]
MKKCFLALGLIIFAASFVQAQDTTKTTKKTKKTDWSKISIGDRANDHFMFQFGYDGWVSVPDSINTSGMGRFLNMYLMLDMPFKTDPRWSVGIGAGIGSSSIFFDKTSIDLKGA